MYHALLKQMWLMCILYSCPNMHTHTEAPSHAAAVHLTLKAQGLVGVLNGRSVLYWVSVRPCVTCVFVSATRVFCFEGAGVENVLWINTNRADQRSFDKSLYSYNPREEEKAGAGEGVPCENTYQTLLEQKKCVFIFRVYLRSLYLGLCWAAACLIVRDLQTQPC